MRLTEIIRTHELIILEDWADRAKRAASARGLAGPEIANLMPTYVASLAGADEALGSFTGSRREVVDRHIGTRVRQGYDVAEIVEEFALLGRCISTTWMRLPVEERPEPGEVDRLYAELHLASVRVADIFADHMSRDEQGEKRFTRLLQNIANEAFGPGGLPFEARLTEVVELVMETMRAQTAAVLLYDPKLNTLISVAAAGPSHEKLEHYATSLDPRSFAGKVAESEEPTSIIDAEITELEVSSLLRMSGIHSLLGVRLPPRRTLLGILYIGLAERREFTAQERSRIETLGGQLTLHLDNARLHSSLLGKIEALEGERTLRERFVSVLAHDLRGPLSTAKMSAQLLDRGPDGPARVGELASKIERSLERVDRMIGDLLDASRIRAGERVPLRLGACDLAAIARQVASDLAEQHGDRFEVRGDSPVGGIWSAEELYRAIWNLGSNAAKYGAPSAPVIIAVEVGDDRARVSVHNLGPPIPKEEQVHLFEPFARTRSAREGRMKGWGLGLTLVHGCAEAHGGFVTVESEPGLGTTFSVDLPRDARPYQPLSRDSVSPEPLH